VGVVALGEYQTPCLLHEPVGAQSRYVQQRQRLLRRGQPIVTHLAEDVLIASSLVPSFGDFCLFETVDAQVADLTPAEHRLAEQWQKRRRLEQHQAPRLVVAGRLVGVVAGRSPFVTQCRPTMPG